VPNYSEIVGAGAAARISNFYHPQQERKWTKTGQRWVLNVGLDVSTQLFKGFWPDVNRKIFHQNYLSCPSAWWWWCQFVWLLALLASVSLVAL
jgi:hypothetical protein